MNVLIVESPSKAKSINKYLGSDFKVLASVGHVRDLSAKNDAIDTENDFKMKWETSDRGKKVIKEITDAAKKSENLYLATDPDREGEAIAWHVEKLLRDNASLSKLNIHRVTFNEITKNAVLDSLKSPREIDENLVNAYLARRALDFLVGFTLSPVLWRKLPGSKSAGRVQSVALRIISERELEIEKFNPKEYWSIQSLSLIHISEPTRPLYISYAVFCLKKKMIQISFLISSLSTFLPSYTVRREFISLSSLFLKLL